MTIKRECWNCSITITKDSPCRHCHAPARPAFRPSELATLRERVRELELALALAEDAAAKGEAARRNAGGMEMRIQELEAEREHLCKTLAERNKTIAILKEERSRWEDDK